MLISILMRYEETWNGMARYGETLKSTGQAKL